VKSVAVVNAAGQIVEITQYDADGRDILRTYGAWESGTA
jgi:hypothetical protein